MKNSPAHEGLRWLAQAERDLDDARFAAKGDRHNLACFLCQQAAEKALKAFLYSMGAQKVWGHSAAELCDDAGEFDKGLLSLRQHAGLLDKYYVPTRYPNGLPGGIPAEAFGVEDSSQALRLATELLEAMARRLKGAAR